MLLMSGNGGGFTHGAQFDPATISNLAMWHDPDNVASISSAVDSTVSDYYDLEGSADWTQATSSLRPTLREKNGVKWLEFAADHMDLVGSDFDAVRYHFIGLVRPELVGKEGLIWGNSALNYQFGFWDDSTTSRFRLVGVNSGDPDLWGNALSYIGVPLTWQIFEAELQPASASLAIDGSTVSTSGVPQNEPIWFNTLGYLNLTSARFSGGMGEHIVTQNPMSASDRSKVIAHLAVKRDLLNAP